MIRKAVPADIPAISALMAEKVPGFLNKGVRFSPSTYEEQVSKFIISGEENAVCLVSDVGNEVAAVILAYVIAHPTIGEVIGGEATWAAHKRFAGHGRKVLSAAEDWFRARGATRFFVNCNNDRTARLLELSGFTQTERTFEKVL
jgi:N-acetylglutamate synthase-like GNAT family acetyltransferase